MEVSRSKNSNGISKRSKEEYLITKKQQDGFL